MEIFRPKLFVIFCGLLIVVWGALQLVSDMRLKEAAKDEAQGMFTWQWPGEVTSQVEITDASVLKRNEHEAVVKVVGKQRFIAEPGRQAKPEHSQPVDCSAILTLYRSSRNWVLGKVEFD
ncbi:MAG TPA: hypothetical protein V6D08_02830 [Candidatus Obscuribacterales bacterium]